MMIANATVTPQKSPAAPADAPDGAGPQDSGDPSGFGALLSQRMDTGSTTDLAPRDVGSRRPGDDPLQAVTHNTQPAASDSVAPDVLPGGLDRGFSVAVSQPMISGAASGRKADASDGAPAVEGPRDPAGEDLAAQLALVSQWAALPPSTASATAVDSSTGGGVAAKLDAVRGKTTMVAASAALLPADAEAARSGAMPAVTPALAPGAERGGAAGASATTAPKGLAVKADGDAKGNGIGDAVASIDAALPKVDAIGAHVPTDATTLANAFVAPVAAHATATVAAAGPSIALHEPVGTTAWAHEVGSASLRMAATDLQSASLRLAPEHLGPVDVQLRIDNGVANLTFHAAHADTRQALESSRTTLDQMFSDQGLRLGDCAVGDFASSRRGSDANASQDAARHDGGRATGAGTPDTDNAGVSTVVARAGRALGLVDTFA